MTKSSLDTTFQRLYETIAERHAKGDPEKSYVAKLANKGRGKICQKLGEEAVEIVVDAMVDKKNGVISESADLMFHLLVLWTDMGITPADIAAELERREGTSGIDEKKNRKK